MTSTSSGVTTLALGPDILEPDCEWTEKTSRAGRSTSSATPSATTPKWVSARRTSAPRTPRSLEVNSSIRSTIAAASGSSAPWASARWAVVASHSEIWVTHRLVMLATCIDDSSATGRSGRLGIGSSSKTRMPSSRHSSASRVEMPCESLRPQKDSTTLWHARYMKACRAPGNALTTASATFIPPAFGLKTKLVGRAHPGTAVCSRAVRASSATQTRRAAWRWGAPSLLKCSWSSQCGSEKDAVPIADTA
eukprot:2652983-Prymnesium_polylepis.1